MAEQLEGGRTLRLWLGHSVDREVRCDLLLWVEEESFLDRSEGYVSSGILVQCHSHSLPEMTHLDGVIIPGTSSVILSLSTPMLHFGGRDFISEPLPEEIGDKAGRLVEFSLSADLSRGLVEGRHRPIFEER